MSWQVAKIGGDPATDCDGTIKDWLGGAVYIGLVSK